MTARTARPERLTGVGDLPDARWYMHPLLHVAVSAIVAALVVRRSLGHRPVPHPPPHPHPLPHREA